MYLKIFNKGLIKNLLLLFSSIVFVFILFELYLRLFNPQIFDIHPQGMYIVDKESGYVLNPGFEGYIQREEFKSRISINKKGLRGKENDEKKENIFRIIVLGDSFGFGFGVEEDETFPVLLEKCLNGSSTGTYEVLNAGIPGYGTVDQLNFLKSRGPELKPDLVILQFLSDNNFDENHYPAAEWANVENGWLTTKDDSSDPANLLPFWRKAEYWFKRNFHSIKFLSERIGYILMKSGLLGDMEKSLWGENFSKEAEELFEKTIVQMFNYTKELGSELIFLYTTGQGQVLTEKEPNLDSEILINRIMSQNNIEWINMFRLMRESEKRNSFYYPIDGHWMPPGHQFVADNLCSKIINHSKN